MERAPAPQAADALDALYGSVEEVPTASATAIVSNEFFDALPVRLARRTEDGWVEECVTYEGANAAVFTDQPGARHAARLCGPLRTRHAGGRAH